MKTTNTLCGDKLRCPASPLANVAGGARFFSSHPGNKHTNSSSNFISLRLLDLHSMYFTATSLAWLIFRLARLRAVEEWRKKWVCFIMKTCYWMDNISPPSSLAKKQEKSYQNFLQSRRNERYCANHSNQRNQCGRCTILRKMNFVKVLHFHSIVERVLRKWNCGKCFRFIGIF